MSVRTVSVKFVANIKDFGSGVKQMVKDTNDFRKELSETAAKGKGDLDKVASAAIAFGAALGGALLVGIKQAVDFEDAMAQVNAVADSTAEEFAEMRQAAIDMGAATAFSANEAANAIEELSKAGLSASQITGGALAGALALAAAGGVGLAEASAIAATTLTQFNLQASEMSAVADTLAGSANASNTDVTGLGQSLKNVGTVAAQMGLTVEETVGLLSALGDNAVVGAEAGTALKTTLLRLLAPTQRAREEMDRLGISVYDANGEALDAVGIIASLEQGLDGLTMAERNAALEIMFGSEAIAGANVLLKEGSQGIGDYIDAVSEQGVAADTAAKRMDSLKGDVENLTGAMESLAIQSSGGATDGLRTLTKAGTEFLDEVNKIPAPISNAVVVIGGLVAAGALMWGMSVKARVHLAEMNAQLAATGPAGAKAATGLSRVGAAANTIIPGLLAIQAASMLLGAALHKDLNPQLDALGAGLERWAESGKLAGEAARILGDDVDDLVESLQAAGDADFRAIAKMGGDPLGLPLGLNDNKLEEAEDKIKAIDSALALLHGENAEAAAMAFDRLSDAALDAGMSVEEIQAIFPEYAAAMEVAAEKTAAAADAVNPYTLQLEVLADMMNLTGDSAEQAVADMILAWSDGATSFVDLLGAFTAGLDELEEDQELTTEGFIEQLRKQAEAQEEWAQNMRTLAERGVGGMIDELARMGPEGAEMVALMADMTDEELQEVVELWGLRGDQTGQEIAAGILEGLEESEAGLDGLQNAINSLHGTTVDIVLRTQNQAALNDFGRFASQARRWGGISYQTARDGLLRDANVYSSQNPARYAFAEPATGGEAFIPRRGNKARSLAILDEAASWYGAEVNAVQWRGQRPLAFASTDTGATTPHGTGKGRQFGSTIVERQEVIVHAHTDAFSYRQTMDDVAWHTAA